MTSYGAVPILAGLLTLALLLAGVAFSTAIVRHGKRRAMAARYCSRSSRSAVLSIFYPQPYVEQPYPMRPEDVLR